MVKKLYTYELKKELHLYISSISLFEEDLLSILQFYRHFVNGKKEKQGIKIRVAECVPRLTSQRADLKKKKETHSILAQRKNNRAK